MLLLWYLILGGLLSIIAVTGNGIVIYLIVTRHRLHTTVNWFILSLAIADFSIGASFLLAKYLCDALSCNGDLWHAISSFLIAASAINLCLMTLDRYIAIVKPLKYVTFMTTRRVVLLISAAWLAAFLPHLIFLMKVVISTSQKDVHVQAFMVFDFVFYETLPNVILPFATGHMFLIARRHSRQNAALVAQLRFNQRIERGKVSAQSKETSSLKVVLVAVAVFLICYVHELCYTILYQLPNKKTNAKDPLVNILQLLYTVNSAVNPVAYAFFKSDIKKSLRSMFHCSKGTHELQAQEFHTKRGQVAPRESTVWKGHKQSVRDKQKLSSKDEAKNLHQDRQQTIY